jgi:hypothetical protein
LFDVLKVTTTSVVQEGWVISALVVVQIALLAMTIGAFAFMLSSLWATLRAVCDELGLCGTMCAWTLTQKISEGR